MTSFLHKYWRQLTADKRKLTLMLLLVGVGLLLWGRLLLKDVPRTVMANPDKSVSLAQHKGSSVPDPGDPLARATVYIDIPDSLTRDLFNQPSLSNKPSAALVISSPGPEKSPPPLADEHQQTAVQDRIAAVLKLQTTILGENPRAMINGQLVAPGESIRCFMIKKILPRQVILENQGMEVILDL